MVHNLGELAMAHTRGAGPQQNLPLSLSLPHNLPPSAPRRPPWLVR